MKAYDPSALCTERERLTDMYLATVVRNVRIGNTVTDINSKAWRDATKETRAACEEARVDLTRHKAEHGC
jgi:hypothetical protein